LRDQHSHAFVLDFRFIERIGAFFTERRAGGGIEDLFLYRRMNRQLQADRADALGFLLIILIVSRRLELLEHLFNAPVMSVSGDANSAKRQRQATEGLLSAGRTPPTIT